MTYTIHAGSNLDILPTLPDNSVDAIVTDPPYGLSDNKFVADTIAKWISGERDFIPDGKGFMGKSWDAFVPPPALWDECLRVLKPGGHLLAFFGSRTQDIGALSIRLAGFEIRDSIAWMYGSGFPKSLDVSKAIDKAAGEKRERVRFSSTSTRVNTYAKDKWTLENIGTRLVDDPITEDAKQWEGWGTALKPAFEPIVVARKPLIGTVAANVLEHGTGALNIDSSRIRTQDKLSGGGSNGKVSASAGWDRPWRTNPEAVNNFAEKRKENTQKAEALGRWPANVILDEYSAEILDEQSEISKPKPEKIAIKGGHGNWGEGGVFDNQTLGTWPADPGGGASRFFYCAKASKRDRNEGLEGLEAATAGEMVDRVEGSAGMNSPRAGAGRTTGSQNFHPTVKPTTLMRYLVKLVTPPGGVVLDPFTGSGSTGKAAILEGFDFIGIELTEEYLPIIEGRLKHAEKVANEDRGLF